MGVFRILNDGKKYCFLRTAIFCASCLLGFLFVNPVYANFITYEFNNTLAANEDGAPLLAAINPIGQNYFTTANVFGETRTVYRFDGNNNPVSEQAGLSLDTRSLIDSDVFSIEMVFSFDQDLLSWQRILDVSNRRNDGGLYINTSQKLAVYPVGNGSDTFTFGVFHHVILTNDGANNINAYLDGMHQFNLTTTSLNFSSHTTANSDKLMHFFADNLTGPGLYEFADGYVSLIRLYDVELSAAEVARLNNDPFAPVPEPATMFLLVSGLLSMTGFKKTRRKK
jgi:hypothetical protein